MPGEHLVENDAHAEQIRPRIERLPFRLLGRHVIRRPDQRPGLRHSRSQRRSRNPKIHHVRPAALVQHDVLWLQIAVNHSFRVRRFQRPASLRDYIGRFRRLQLLLAAKQALQILAFDVIHGDELEPVGLPQIKNTDDVLMCDLPRQYQFLFESFQDFRIGRQIAANQLQRHLTFQFAIVSLVHRAHAALSQQANNLVAPAQNRAGIQLSKA